MEYEGRTVSSLMCFPALTYTRGVYSSSTDDTLERCRPQKHSAQATRPADSTEVDHWETVDHQYMALESLFKHAVKYLR